MASIDKLFLDAETNDEFILQLMSSIVLATKESNSLPKGTDFDYHSLYPEFLTANRNAAKGTMALIQRICDSVKSEEGVRLPDDMADPALYEQIVDVIDSLLQGADQYLDARDGRKGKLSASVGQSMGLDKARLLKESLASLPKPQLKFQAEIDNSRKRPFRPRLEEKYHATVAPLNLQARPVEDEEVVGVGADTYFPHPYEPELRAMPFPSWCQGEVPRGSAATYAQSPYLFVDSVQSFESMLSALRGSSEVAVDLEHHAHHTFQGLTCLMQLSSRDQDFIIDTLELRGEMHRLGGVFADPGVVKVLHGCDRDVLWMQRDCGLYLVNCFDTHVAAKALQYPALSLAHLLGVHCGITVDKKHQLSDWRRRPLSEEMLHYAAGDTRYLLYVYDQMRRELWNKLGAGGLEHVFDASRQLCLQRYEKFTFDALGYRSLFGKVTLRGVPRLADLNAPQVAALSTLWGWRDMVARGEDESCVAVMSNAEVLRIGTQLPRNVAQLEAQCGPLSAPTRARADELILLLHDVTSFGPSSSGQEGGEGSVGLYSTPGKRMRAGEATNANANVNASMAPTVQTFTPAITAPRSVAEEGEPSRGTYSPAQPELPQTPTDEIFRLAGWSTPQPTRVDLDDLSELDFPPVTFDAQMGEAVSEAQRGRVRLSRDELAGQYASERVFQARLHNLVARDGAPQPGTLPSAPEVEEESAIEIPRSFEEVYLLSQRNRHRNKEKKSAEEGFETAASSMDMDAPQSQQSLESQSRRSEEPAGFDPNNYFAASQREGKIDTDVDSTLQFARSVGWIKSAAESDAVKGVHLRDVSLQQQEGAPQDDGSVSNRSEGALRQSFERPRKSGSGGSGSGRYDTAPSSQQRRPQAKGAKVFDYSKLPQGMGAMPAPPQAQGGQGGKGKPGNNRKGDGGK
ncbi:ribonuclease H-like domain-containing protein [Ochromonadaceae sp. CCMP2298]|nr:ribonuclease H-like domain-containing protein [Ochromonadaceae sp. CCMP2298]|mmetsp:Transcript_30870/g.68153  ORF Transcript_30870/g.68153 Transcript_30870/m.68153 type:complete len:913 (-) Transcript_30870:195-2933(-)